MRLMLSNGNMIGLDRFVSGVIRYDCVPVPATIEFQVLLDDEMDKLLQEKSIITVGDNYLELSIVTRSINNTGVLKDDKLLKLGAYIAVLKGCEQLIVPASSAISAENTSIGACLRAGGSRLKVREDVPLMNYFCPIGETPTYPIARMCAQEACVIYCDSQGKIIVKRLSQIMSQEHKAEFEQSAVQWVENQSQINHSIPTYQTINADGSTVEGSLKAGVRTSFYPNLDARRAKNLSTALVTRGTIIRAYSPQFIAGDVILCNRKKYVILTVAHRFDTGILGGPSVATTKIWLAEVVSV